jgi:formate dehydrogenase (NADP+) beta subunit
MPPVVDEALCEKCGKCVENCPGNVLELSPDGPKVAYPDECWHCGVCRMYCPVGGISYRFKLCMLL